MMRAVITTLALLCTSVSAASAEDNEVLGKAGKAEIRVDEVRKHLEILPQADRTVLEKDSAKLAQVVRTYLAERMVLKSAHDAGFDQQPEVVAKLQETHDALLKELYLQSITKVSGEYPTDADMQAFYDANKSAFIPAKLYHVAQIYIAAPTGDKSSERLEELTKKLAAKNADFAALARDYSDMKNEAEKGGEIGWLEERTLAPEIKAAVAQLAKGRYTQPIRLPDGWHIVKLIDIKAAGTEPVAFADIKTSLAQQMRRQRITKERQDFVTGLIDKNGLVINELAFSKLTPALKEKPGEH